MRNAVATRRAPGGVEIQDQDLAFVLGKDRVVTICELPAHVGE